MRDYLLITGATGLLGAYLLRDFLGCGVRCAVLVRSNRMESAEQRVESILARMERESGTILPRPVVLEGTLSENFGLDAEQTEWVRRHCGRMLHNAASLVFERDPKTDEPYRSNVAGTNHAIEFALRCGIAQFHHVSTAYVCGLRTGVCREDELDVGQQWGNDYETAKVTAEKAVRAASFPEPPTFYRPAIITGDSVTGYTSTYHGFYTPLKVAATLVADRSFRSSADDILHFLGMKGEEHKNFVPVEWISQAIVSLMKKPEHIGGTFHLTPKNRVTVERMYRVFTDALLRYGEQHAKDVVRTPSPKNDLSPETLNALLESFREQMKVYRSYWRDDPVFDSSHTDAALPDLPCPEMTEDVLFRLSMFALESNFGWPKSQPILPPFFVRDLLPQKPTFGGGEPSGSGRIFGLDVRGPGGGAWSLSVRDRRVESVRAGIDPAAEGRFVLGSQMCGALLGGKTALSDALDRGAVGWEFSVAGKKGDAVEVLTALAGTKKGA